MMILYHCSISVTFYGSSDPSHSFFNQRIPKLFPKRFSRIYPLVLLLLRIANYNYGKYQNKIASKPLLVFLNAYVLLLEWDRDRLADEAGGIFRTNVLLRLRSQIKIRLIIRQSVPSQLYRL